ncbi:MAG: hypothetical protein R6V35_00600 [Candidatus Nanohaloarchaea archaeon]
MSKFWGITFTILLVGVTGLILGVNAQEIHFTDLETECRFDRGESVDVSAQNNHLQVEGFFPVQNTQADMKYTYEERNDRIILNVYAEDEFEPQDFEHTCYAVGVYDAETVPVDGQKWVTVKHQGEQVYKSRIDFR